MCRVAFSIALVALLAAPASSVYAQEHQHAPPPRTSAAVPAHGYATDATLRQQMREIRTEVAAIENFQHGRSTQPQAIDAAGRITGHVNTIIANCKLPPDADEALHTIIGPMLQHASALKASPDSSAAVTSLHGLLDQYAREFDDPGFSKPAR
ncbi:MAG: hypothetical protein OJF55_002087 [Rhodanobacteraceae bacterium]|jgi:hypothetical protein|nr:MAG: hypothetical protein OJF55_002087 [Rhodanobacteraceae bacterium]